MADLLDIILGIDVSQIKTAKQEMAELGNSFNSATKSASIFEQAFARAAAQSAKDANFLRDVVRANQELINANLGVSNSYKSAQQSASAFSVVLGNLDKVAKATIDDFNDRVGITGFFKSAEQSASSFEVVLNNIDRQAKSFTAAFNQKVGITGTRATDSGAGYSAIAAQAVKEEAAARELVATATKREADQLEYLNMKYDMAYAAAKLYKTVQDEINLAMSKGVGNADQLQAQLNKLEMEYAAFGAGTTDIKNRFVQQAAAVEQSRKGVNKWGLLVQQTGYQAGDFLVQIQSGTNIFVAFGQQATQLVGILPMFATELGVSAVALGGITLGLSIAIPLITAIGAGFMRSSEDTKKAKTALDELDSSLKGIDGTLRTWENTKAAVAAGITVEQLIGQRGLGQAKADQIAAIKELDAAWAASSTRPDVRGESASFTLFGKSTDQKVTEAQTKVEEATKRLADIQTKLSEEQKASYDEQYNSLVQNYAMEKTIAEFGSDSAEAKKLELRQALDDYNSQIDAQVKSNEISVAQGDALKVINRQGQEAVVNAEEAAKEEERKHKALIRSYQYMGNTMRLSAQQVSNEKEQSDALTQRYMMEMDIAKFGKDSAEVKKRQREDELALYDKGIDKQVLSGQLEKTAGDVLKIRNRSRQDAVDLQQEETDALNRGSKLVRDYLSTYLNIGKAVDNISKLDIKSVFSDAVSPSGAVYQFVKNTYDTMSKMVGMAAASQRTDYYKLGTLNEGMMGRAGGKGQGQKRDYSFVPPTATTNTLGDAGGGGVKTDPLAELQKQIALQEELNGKTEAEIKVRQALGEDFSKYSPMVIKGLEDQIQKQTELEERLKEQQGIFDTVKSSMEDAFMGMVDGTKSAKDAFKSMAAAIIKELYNVLVVQRLVGSFNASTGVGNGLMGAIMGGLSGGKPLAGGSMRANGGPVSAGQPYLVGERGPELIIPKSSGMVLTNGQTKAALGGASNDNYVVHNNITVTGSDSVMVRQEIAKMIPQISSATKAAMIDAKRRGGQMGNAFK